MTTRNAALALLLLAGCGSAAQANLSPNVVPQTISLNLDASDGGTITIGGGCEVPAAPTPEDDTAITCSGEIWLDARAGSVASEHRMLGNDIAPQTRVDPTTNVGIPAPAP